MTQYGISHTPEYLLADLLEESAKKWRGEIEQKKVKRDFLQELIALLVKWDANIEADDHYKGYPECGSDIRIEISVPPVYLGGELVRPGVDINLGKYFYPELKEEP